jgi:hypothetical protein
MDVDQTGDDSAALEITLFDSERPRQYREISAGPQNGLPTHQQMRVPLGVGIVQIDISQQLHRASDSWTVR